MTVWLEIEDSKQKEEKARMLKHGGVVSETEHWLVWLEHSEQGAGWHRMRSERARGETTGCLAVLGAHALVCSVGIKYMGKGALKEESL